MRRARKSREPRLPAAHGTTSVACGRQTVGGRSFRGFDEIIPGDRAMSREHATPTHPDRRDFLKTAGAATAGALLLPHLEALAATPGTARFASGASAGWTARPFALSHV